MRYLSAIGFSVLLLFAWPASGQYYETGQDPARIKWMQVKTGRFTVIYPESYGNQGVEFARSLDHSYSDITGNLFSPSAFRLPVVIHSYTTQANGYVAWAPKRMELYPTPEQNTIPLDQKRQLTLHELTHVMQMVSLNTGFSKGMSFVFGQQFPGAVASLLPQWYMEGEAVFAESVLTQAGRGRSPSFQKELKALTIEKGFPYRYDKIINGSYRNHIPDHYQLGYQMVALSMNQFGNDLWRKTLRTTANIPFAINPVNISLSRNAGTKKKALFQQTFDTLGVLWRRDIAAGDARDYIPANPDKKGHYVNYYSPLFAGADSVIAIKTSLSDPPSIVLLTGSAEKKEKKIFSPGSIYPWFISRGGSKIVWVESRMDPRWENANYSVIRILDIKTGLTRQLSFCSRFLAATISHDARLIAAAENTLDNRNNLVLVDPSDGHITESIPAPGNAFLQHPQWSSNDDKLTVIYLTEKGEGILVYDLISKTWSNLVDAATNDLQSTFLRNDSLFYVSSVSGTDDAYLLTPERSTFKLTRTKFGAIDISVKGQEIMFCNYTSSGNEISTASLKEANEYGNDFQKSSYLAERFSLDNNTGNYEEGKYFPVPYRKWQHLFSFHSWMPVYADLDAVQTDPASIRPGISILSQNQLGTLISSVGYEYSADHRHLLHSKITWKGWYPVIESRLDYNVQQEVSKLNENVNWTPQDIRTGYRFNNSVYIPLNFTSGRFYHHIMPELTVNYVNKYVYLKEKRDYDYGQAQVTGRLYISNYSLSSARDIYPRWAQVFDLYYTSAPFDKLIYGTDLALKTAFYFPGIIKNQSLRVKLEKEKQDFAKYLTSNRINFPRGYENIISEKLTVFTAEYSAPLLYPDLSLTSVLYIKRIRGNLFFDYASASNIYYLINQSGSLSVGTHNTGSQNFRSYGFELLSDFHLFRIPFPITAGVQAGWKDGDSTPDLKMIFSVDVYGMSIGAFKHSKSRY